MRTRTGTRHGRNVKEVQLTTFSLFLRILHAGALKGLPIGDSRKLLRNSVSLSSLRYLLELAIELQKTG